MSELVPKFDGGMCFLAIFDLAYNALPSLNYLIYLNLIAHASTWHSSIEITGAESSNREVTYSIFWV